MLVRCIDLINEKTGEKISFSSWLSVGSVYLVLSVSQGSLGKLDFRLIGDNGIAAYHNVEQFETISDYIPSNWHVTFLKKKFFCLQPKAWSELGFWELYFDGDPHAIKIFEDEKAKMIAEEPLPYVR